MIVFAGSLVAPLPSWTSCMVELHSSPKVLTPVVLPIDLLNPQALHKIRLSFHHRVPLILYVQSGLLYPFCHSLRYLNLPSHSRYFPPIMSTGTISLIYKHYGNKIYSSVCFLFSSVNY